MVQSWDPHSGERTYIYAQEAGTDMKVLLVTLEANEAVVFEMKMDPRKFNEFAHDAIAGRPQRSYSTVDETQPEPRVEAESSSAASWEGFCLLAGEAQSPREP
jgi:hypothetical protein